MSKVFELKRCISFSLERRKDTKGQVMSLNVPIRMTVTYSGSRVTFYAGYRIDASKWDDKKQRVKANTTNQKGQTASHINNKLNNLSAGIDEYFKECEVKRYMPNNADVKEAFSRLSNEKKSSATSFFHTFDEFVKTVGKENDWSEAAFTKFTTIRNHLSGFDKDLSFESLNSDKMTKLVAYYRDTLNSRNTTVDKNLKFVRWFLRWAAKHHHAVNPTALEYKPNLKGTDGKIKKVIFLSKDELFHLYNLPIRSPKRYLERVRDVFCFCCFSGLRYSDAYNLTKSSDKGTYIEFVTQKTQETLVVQLNKYSRALLDKYKNIPFAKGKALPVISNQKMNDYLKELGQLAELNELETIVYYKGNRRIEETYPKHALLTTHCGRKTFVTNLFTWAFRITSLKTGQAIKTTKALKPIIR